MSSLAFIINIVPFISIISIELVSPPVQSRYKETFEKYFESDEYVTGDWSSILSEHEDLDTKEVGQIAEMIEDEASASRDDILSDTRDYTRYVSDMSRTIVNLVMTAIAIIILLGARLLVAATDTSSSNTQLGALTVVLLLTGIFSIIGLIYFYSRFQSVDPHAYSRDEWWITNTSPGRVYIIVINSLATLSIISISLS